MMQSKPNERLSLQDSMYFALFNDDFKDNDDFTGM